MCPSKRPFGFDHESQIILALSVWKKCVLCCCEFILISFQKWGFYCYCQRGWNYVPLAYMRGVFLPSLQAVVVVAQLVVAGAPVPVKLEFVWYKWLLLPVDLPWICDLLNLSAQVVPILAPPVMYLMWSLHSGLKYFSFLRGVLPRSPWATGCFCATQSGLLYRADLFALLKNGAEF